MCHARTWEQKVNQFKSARRRQGGRFDTGIVFMHRIVGLIRNGMEGKACNFPDITTCSEADRHRAPNHCVGAAS